MSVSIRGGAAPEEIAAILAVLASRPRGALRRTGLPAWRDQRHAALRPSVTPPPRRNRG